MNHNDLIWQVFYPLQLNYRLHYWYDTNLNRGESFESEWVTIPVPGITQFSQHSSLL